MPRTASPETPTAFDGATSTVTFSDAPLSALLRHAADWLDERPSANVWTVSVSNRSDDGDDDLWDVSLTRQARLTNLARRHAIGLHPRHGDLLMPRTASPETPTRLDLAPIKARAEAATPGPWRWYGYVDGDVYLATTHSGRLIVLDHDQPALRFRRGPTMEDARTFAVREADYRPDIARIDHPDAEFIAHARADVDALLAEVAHLNGAILDALGLMVAGDAEAAEVLLGRMTDRIGLVGEDARDGA